MARQDPIDVLKTYFHLFHDDVDEILDGFNANQLWRLVSVFLDVVEMDRWCIEEDDFSFALIIHSELPKGYEDYLLKLVNLYALDKRYEENNKNDNEN